MMTEPTTEQSLDCYDCGTEVTPEDVALGVRLNGAFHGLCAVCLTDPERRELP